MYIIDFIVSGLRLIFVDNLLVTLTLVLGLAAIYLLLPRPQRYPTLVGTVAAGLAVLCAGFFLVRVAALTVETVLFYLFSAVAVVAAGLLVTQRNPARAALAFALVILATSGLFLLLAAPFLMAATLIVYAGAIIVTFLFVLMLAQQQRLSDADARSREPLLSTATGFVLLGTLLFLLKTTYLNEATPWIDRAGAGVTRLQELQARRARGDNPPSTEEVRTAAREIDGMAQQWKKSLASTDALVPAIDLVIAEASLAANVQEAGEADLPALEETLDRARAQAQLRVGILRPVPDGQRAAAEDSTGLKQHIQKLTKQLVIIREYRQKPDTTPEVVVVLLSDPRDSTSVVLRRLSEDWQRKRRATDEPLAKALADAQAAVNAESAKASKNEAADLTAVERSLEAVRREAVAARGASRLSHEPLSSLSGPPASLPPGEIRRDAEGRPHLPAENARQLGVSVFGDYLLAVEMGGMLLLVATVGAIAIATRGRSTRSPAQVMANGAAAGRN